ncbi:exported hypothetical protein [uncultured Desulfobacterium sp.]|uniref:PKD/Chitinase domain-containing protein n=1 Tax=uncultured Desulfobacterium sp. TaxID=201089 RepID=A0A445N1Q2_9BACT|nr:exported hypothetical protein [uncultured Desulfobacterium sp.]
MSLRNVSFGSARKVLFLLLVMVCLSLLHLNMLSYGVARAAEPVADAGQYNLIVKDNPISGAVVLNGSGSFDNDGDPMNYHWYGAFPTSTGLNPSVDIPEGTYTVSLAVDDGSYISQVDTTTITVNPGFSIAARCKPGKVQLTWTHIAGTERYDIYRSTESDPTNFVKIAETTSTYSTYLDEPVANEVTYLYVVGAVSQGIWQYSNVTSSHPTALRVIANYAPAIYSKPITTATTGIIYNYDVNATDPNGNALTYSLSTTHSGMGIDQTTGLITWTPQETGSYDVITEVSDGKGGTDTQSFTIIVEPISLDNCPDDPDKINAGICGCGIADIDTDADGIADCLDQCPNDANKTEPGACGCGNSDIDTDGDGPPDCIDGCPSDGNKTSPGACGCGLSDTDSDGDGTSDCLDNCPNDPNKTAPGDCGCGETDIDTDGDGAPDCMDACPSDPNKIDPGACGCGVSDIDSDGDGVPDCSDGCPDDPNKLTQGACGCRVTDADSDGDGTPDCNDGCPSDGNKVEPGACGCGKADTDTDGDGVPDCNDSCPEDPNKAAPGACGCGVADTDSDNDGVPDCMDACPNTPSGEAVDGDGCSSSQRTSKVIGPEGGVVEVTDPNNPVYGLAIHFSENTVSEFITVTISGSVNLIV